MANTNPNTNVDPSAPKPSLALPMRDPSVRTGKTWDNASGITGGVRDALAANYASVSNLLNLDRDELQTLERQKIDEADREHSRLQEMVKEALEKSEQLQVPSGDRGHEKAAEIEKVLQEIAGNLYDAVLQFLHGENAELKERVDKMKPAAEYDAAQTRIRELEGNLASQQQDYRQEMKKKTDRIDELEKEALARNEAALLQQQQYHDKLATAKEEARQEHENKLKEALSAVGTSTAETLKKLVDNTLAQRTAEHDATVQSERSNAATLQTRLTESSDENKRLEGELQARDQRIAVLSSERDGLKAENGQTALQRDMFKQAYETFGAAFEKMKGTLQESVDTAVAATTAAKAGVISKLERDLRIERAGRSREVGNLKNALNAALGSVQQAEQSLLQGDAAHRDRVQQAYGQSALINAELTQVKLQLSQTEAELQRRAEEHDRALATLQEECDQQIRDWSKWGEDWQKYSDESKNRAMQWEQSARASNRAKTGAEQKITALEARVSKQKELIDKFKELVRSSQRKYADLEAIAKTMQAHLESGWQREDRLSKALRNFTD